MTTHFLLSQVLPIAIVRWDAFLGHCIPLSATIASDFIFACSGLLNVLLFTITRPALVPHRTGVNFGMGIRAGTSLSSSPPGYAAGQTSSSWGPGSPTQRTSPDTMRMGTTAVLNDSTPNIHVRFPGPVDSRHEYVFSRRLIHIY